MCFADVGKPRLVQDLRRHREHPLKQKNVNHGNDTTGNQANLSLNLMHNFVLWQLGAFIGADITCLIHLLIFWRFTQFGCTYLVRGAQNSKRQPFECESSVSSIRRRTIFVAWIIGTWRMSWVSGFDGESGSSQDLGAQRQSWHIVAAKSAEILLLGWRWRIQWTNDVTNDGTELGNSGKSDMLKIQIDFLISFN